MFFAKISDTENSIKDTMNNVALINYDQSIQRTSTNMVPVSSLIERLYDSYNSEEFLSAFIKNFTTGNTIYFTAQKYEDIFGANSYDMISNNLSIEEAELGSFEISFISNDVSLGKKILKDLVVDNEAMINNDLNNILTLRLQNLKKLFDIDNKFYRSLIATEIKIIDENIALAEHLEMENPASEELKSRAEQLISVDIGNRERFNVPLYLYGYKALNVVRDIMTSRLNDRQIAPFIQASIEQTEYLIELTNTDYVRYVKFNENVIYTKSERLPLQFFILAGFILGLPIAILLAFFRLSHSHRFVKA